MTTATAAPLICRPCGRTMAQLRLCWWCLTSICSACDVHNRCLCAKERDKEVN